MKTDELKLTVDLLVTMELTLKQLENSVRQLIRTVELEIDRRELEQRLM